MDSNIINASIIIDGSYLFRVLTNFQKDLFTINFPPDYIDSFNERLCNNVLDTLKKTPNISYANNKAKNLVKHSETKLIINKELQYLFPIKCSEREFELPENLLKSFENSNFHIKFHNSKIDKVQCKNCGNLVSTINDTGIVCDMTFTILELLKQINIDILFLISGEKNFDPAFEMLRKKQIDVILVSTDSLLHEKPYLSNCITMFYEINTILSIPEESKEIKPIIIEKGIIEVNEELRIKKHYKEMSMKDKIDIIRIIRKGKQIKTSPCKLFHSQNQLCKYTEAKCNYLHDDLYRGLFVPDKTRDIHREIINCIDRKSVV